MRRKFVLSVLALSVLVMLLPSLAQAQGRTITGLVTGTAGDYKSLASITLEGPNRYLALANSVGQFKVENVLPGRYTVTVRQGNNVQKFIVDLDGSPTLELAVRW